MMKILAISVFVTTCCVVMASAHADVQQSRHHDFKVTTLVEGLEHPWSIAFLPDGEWLITERPGRLRHVVDGELLATPVSGAPQVHAEGQGGLLDVVLHPEFSENRFVYFTYSKRCASEGNTTAVGRGVWRDGAIHDYKEIFEADACAPRGRHHGSRIVFDRDGYLFVTVGDRGMDPRAQDPTDNAGVTLRLNDDGSIPNDNPFVGRAGHDANWTWGNRNAQGMALNPVTGEVWLNEHGPRGGDEINVVKRGSNYGWPTVTYGTQYSGEIISTKTHEEAGMEPPIKQWTPSIAVSGMAFYSGDAFPQWRNDVFVGALNLQHVARVRFDGHREVEEERLLERQVGRVRDVRVGPDGLIYILTDARDGKLIRLEPAE